MALEIKNQSSHVFECNFIGKYSVFRAALFVCLCAISNGLSLARSFCKRKLALVPFAHVCDTSYQQIRNFCKIVRILLVNSCLSVAISGRQNEMENVAFAMVLLLFMSLLLIHLVSAAADDSAPRREHSNLCRLL